ncbi:hypothetical protein E2C01_005470 [Portunus trituberculatus]|uniref:Uncharacterized protein n=1 Tax=Portunus trituberculatus TaxID=210409 RepID=A0A5B7CSV0_PORTR|nr:hypothetical protein [Portunus trituberculatus]
MKIAKLVTNQPRKKTKAHAAQLTPAIDAARRALSCRLAYYHRGQRSDCAWCGDGSGSAAADGSRTVGLWQYSCEPPHSVLKMHQPILRSEQIMHHMDTKLVLGQQNVITARSMGGTWHNMGSGHFWIKFVNTRFFT